MSASLRPYYQKDVPEAGCDEAGRGCLAGPVVAAAVILPKDFYHPLLNDSKQLTETQRYTLRPIIQENAIAWAIAEIDAPTIDRINILQASFMAMHEAVEKLHTTPQLLLIDGNRFKPYFGISHVCVVQGDALYANIAAASILAKTYRDDLMLALHEQHPQYDWASNKGYPTPAHKKAIKEHGLTVWHRKTFRS
jgi:ribonuclease HII